MSEVRKDGKRRAAIAVLEVLAQEGSDAASALRRLGVFEELREWDDVADARDDAQMGAIGIRERLNRWVELDESVAAAVEAVAVLIEEAI